MIDALIFDFDGVIIDTETPDYESWAEVFCSYGVTLDISLWSGFIGTTPGAFDPVDHLAKLVGRQVDREEVRRQKCQRYSTLIDNSPILPGVMEYICEAGGLGIKLGVASSSSRWWVEGNLNKRGLLDRFDSIVTSDDVIDVKPCPELYLISLQRLGMQPDRAIAIEDSAHGITAAKNAGLYCIAVPNPMTRHLPIDHADIRVESLSDLPLTNLINRLTDSAPGSDKTL